MDFVGETPSIKQGGTATSAIPGSIKIPHVPFMGVEEQVVEAPDGEDQPGTVSPSRRPRSAHLSSYDPSSWYGATGVRLLLGAGTLLGGDAYVVEDLAGLLRGDTGLTRRDLTDLSGGALVVDVGEGGGGEAAVVRFTLPAYIPPPPHQAPPTPSPPPARVC